MRILKSVLFFTIVVAALSYYFRSNLKNLITIFKTEAYAYNSASAKKVLNYRLHIPSLKSRQKYPLVLVLHGASQRGNDNKSQIDNLSGTFISNKVQRKFPSFVLVPQCPGSTQWLNTSFKSTPFGHYNQKEIPESDEMKMIVELIRELTLKYRIDESRIYVTGFSMGSSGTWDIITRHPDIFAAAIPISGVSDPETARFINHIPVWAFHGELDTVSPVQLNRDMQNAILKEGGNCKLTTFKNEGHNCVNPALKYPGVFDWLFNQQKNRKSFAG